MSGLSEAQKKIRTPGLHAPPIMASVAIDIFQFPEIEFEEKIYDCVVVCVDRHSNWMIAIPELMKGLNGTRVAKGLLKQCEFLEYPRE